MWSYELGYNPLEKSLDITPKDYSPNAESTFLGRLNLPNWVRDMMKKDNNVVTFNEVFEPLPVQEFNRAAKYQNIDDANIPIIGLDNSTWNIHTLSQYSGKKMRLILLPDYFPKIEYNYLDSIIRDIFSNRANIGESIGIAQSISQAHISHMKSVRMLYPPALPETIYDPSDDSWNEGFEKKILSQYYRERYRYFSSILHAIKK